MSTQANAAAVRAFRLIDILAKAGKPLSLTEIVDEIDLPKQTVHRLLKQLEGASLVARTEPHRYYECSARVRQMAMNLLMKVGAPAARRAILHGVADFVHETCNLTVPGGEDVVYLDRVEINWCQRISLSAGSRVPFHCTASGKLFLSFLPRQQRERIIEQLPLRRYTSQTITDLDQLRCELQDIRKRRFSFNNEEYMSGVVAIGVPVLLGRGSACAAITIQSPLDRMPVAQLQTFLPALRTAAEKAGRTFQ